MNRDRLGFGILGAGRISTLGVGPAIAGSSCCRVAAVGARDRERATGLARRLDPSASGYGSYEAVLDDPAVEAVYIGLTNDAHVPWVLRALESGRPVLCEKPLGLDAAQVSAAFDAADAAGLLLVEASWYRWHPRTRLAEELLAAGDLGPVGVVDAGFTFGGVRPGDYRMDPARGGGALYDVGCYALSALGWASRWAPPDVVSVERRVHSGVDLATTARLALGLVEGRVHCAIDEDEQQWIEIGAVRGRLRFGPPAFTAWQRDTARLEIMEGERVVRSHDFPPTNPYAVMVDAFAGRVAGGADWVVPRRDSEWVASATDRLIASG